MTNHPLRCRCGKVQGYLTTAASATRAVCYCKDCQAYARFLGTPGIVDDAGGTEVVASLPRYLHFTAGSEAIACMSLKERGLLRWYASCCLTPIGNTPRDPKVSYVGVVSTCLEDRSPSIDASFGRRRIAVNTKSARRLVRSTPFTTLAAVAKLMLSLASARATGAHKANPFFEPGTRSPIRPVRVLSKDERARAYGLPP